VAVLGYKHGDRTLGRLDSACLVGALVALGLWRSLNSPATAAVTIVATDFLAAIPTLKHAWGRPYEETWASFALYGLSGVGTLLVADFAVVTAFVYPLYITLIDFTIALLVLVSPHRVRANGQAHPPMCSG
jgi:hypothetical protein